jgi:hypothetical protein
MRGLVCLVVVAMIATMGQLGQEPVNAATISWANWTSATIDPYMGTATGLIGSISVNYAGEVGGNTIVGAGLDADSDYPIWGPTSSFVGGTVENAPTFGDIIALTGANGSVNTVTFSIPVVNPVMAIWSLGGCGYVRGYAFDNSQPFVIQAGGPNNRYGGETIYIDATPYTVFGNEGNGTIQFLGSFTSLSWTVPTPDYYDGFTIGVPVPEPSTFALLGIAVFSLLACAWRRGKLMRRTYVVFAVIAAIGLFAEPLMASGIVNGGFETGDLSGWSYQTSNGGSVTVESGGATEGTYYARLLASSSNMEMVSATLTQEFDAVAGDRLSFSYLDHTQGNMVVNAGVAPGVGFLVGPYNPFNVHGEWCEATNQNTWTSYYEFTSSGHYTFSVSAVAMNAIADLSVDAVLLTPVPEPSTFALLGVGVFGLLAYAWRRQAR